MRLVPTINPILRNHVQHILTEKGDPCVLLEEEKNMVESVFHHHLLW